MRPLIKWAGGKRALLPLLCDAWHDRPHRRLIEPFAGSAAFFFAVEPEAALLSDACEPLMHMYFALQAFPEDLVASFEALCEAYPQPGEEAYYQVRQRFNDGELTLVDEAAHFLYLNRFSFHGLWRVNADGVMNTGYGHYDRPPIPTALAMREVSRVLSKATLYHDDWEVTASQAGEGDFLYLDPPYFGSWGSYSAKGMGFDLAAHHRIAQVAQLAHDRGATVVVSSKDCLAVREIFPEENWGHLPVGIVQKIAPQNGGRQPEMLITAC